MTSRANISIAVIIVNYNGGEFIGPCLSALEHQTRKPDRILVVDNGSEDGSNALVSSEFKNVELLQLDSNTGFAAANNRGFEQLNAGQWVALLNPDTVPDRNWLKMLEDAVIANPQVDIFASKLMFLRVPSSALCFICCLAKPVKRQLRNISCISSRFRRHTVHFARSLRLHDGWEAIAFFPGPLDPLPCPVQTPK